MPPTVLMRPPAASFRECLVRGGQREPINVERALAQHGAYRDLLEALGAQPLLLEPLDRFPDSVFVEDAAIVVDDLALLCPFAVSGRRGEEAHLAETLSAYKHVRSFTPPATIDGGDVIVTERDIFVGISARTNKAACDQLAEFLPDRCVKAVEFDDARLLHLKSGGSYLGRGTVLVAAGALRRNSFDGYSILETPSGEEAAANTLQIRETVILPAGFPKTGELLSRHGFEARQVDISEFAKGDGSVSCLTVVLG